MQQSGQRGHSKESVENKEIGRSLLVKCPDNVVHHPSAVNCMPTANKSNCHPTQPDIWATQVESRPSQWHRNEFELDSLKRATSAKVFLERHIWNYATCIGAAAALCHIRILYALASIQAANQSNQPVNQPTIPSSVRPSGCLAIYPDRVSLQLSALYFAVHHHCHWQFRVVTMANRVAKRRQG